MTLDLDYAKWLTRIMACRPKNNPYLDSERGMEVGRIALEAERENYAWRRSDPDVFWLDVQLFVKYKLDDDEIRFVINLQPGIEQYKDHKDERRAYGEFTRGLEKLRKMERENTR